MPMTVLDDREAALRVGYEATAWTQPVAFEDYRAALADWNVSLLTRGADLCGALFERGDEVHFSILPEWRRKWLTKDFLRRMLDRRRIVTRVTPGHEDVIAMLERVGFRQQADGLMVKEAQDGN